jgi:hypothetical protein
MAAVRKVCHITMDTLVEAAMNVHRKDGTIMKFREYKSGLYYYDASEHRAASNPTSTSEDYIFLNTVAGSKANLTQREIKGADKARTLYRKIGHPAEQEYNEILDNNSIRNCPVTSDDARRALHISTDQNWPRLKAKPLRSKTRASQITYQSKFRHPSSQDTKTYGFSWTSFGSMVAHFSTQYRNSSSSVQSRQSTPDLRGHY